MSMAVYIGDTPEENQGGDLAVLLNGRQVLLPASRIRADSEDK